VPQPQALRSRLPGGTRNSSDFSSAGKTMDDPENINHSDDAQRRELAGYLKHCARQDAFAEFERELKAARDIVVAADVDAAFDWRIVRALCALKKALDP
jgi:hypothetical protein